jgi:hypothetical protein
VAAECLPGGGTAPTGRTAAAAALTAALTARSLVAVVLAYQGNGGGRTAAAAALTAALRARSLLAVVLACQGKGRRGRRGRRLRYPCPYQGRLRRER